MDIVSEQFMPDSTALALLRQDVTSPWTKNTTPTRRVLQAEVGQDACVLDPDTG